jgi:enediyne biosynthesis protein E4
MNRFSVLPGQATEPVDDQFCRIMAQSSAGCSLIVCRSMIDGVCLQFDLSVPCSQSVVSSMDEHHRSMNCTGMSTEFHFRLLTFVGATLIAVSLSSCGRSSQPTITDEIGKKTSVATEARLPSETSSPELTRIRSDSDWFDDVTESSGIAFTYRNGSEANQFTILETVGGGVGVFDFDSDGQQDVFCVGGGTIDPGSVTPSGHPCHLFHNLGNFQFKDVTVSCHAPGDTDYSHGCVAGDIDNDGFPDLFVTCYGHSCLMLNCGDGTFVDITNSAGLADESWSTAAAFGDVDGDGSVDLYVANYTDWSPEVHTPCRNSIDQTIDVCPPQNYNPLPDRLYRNQGNGEFQEVSEEMGLRKDGMGLGVLAADINQDGKIDFFVANDAVANRLYLSSERHPFIETAEFAGVAYNEGGSPEGCMGVDVEDIDGDGLCELWVTNFEMEDNSLFQNQGNGLFQHATAAFGLAGQSRVNVGFGTGLHDFDGDSWMDVYVLNGHVLYNNGIRPFCQPAFVFRNFDGRKFVDVTDSAGTWFHVSHSARGGAVGDLDGNGMLDLIISSIDEPTAVLRNQLPAKNWIRLQLVGRQSSRIPVGARVTVEAFCRNCVRLTKSGSGFLSQSDSRILFAIEPERAEVDVEVTWPSGKRETFRARATATDHVLIEGSGAD